MSSRAVAVVCVRDGVVPAGGAEAAAEADEMSGVAGSVAIVLGTGAMEAAADLSGLAGSIEVAELEGFAPARWAAALAGTPLVAEASCVVLPASPDGRDLAVRLAAQLGWPLLANTVRITLEDVTVVRWGGLVQHRVQPAGPFVATLQPGARRSAADPGRATHVTVLDLETGRDDRDDRGPAITDATTLGLLPLDATTIDLADAPRLVGGGAGLMRADDVAARFEQLRAVGAAIGASVGATRVVTDAGWLGHDRQIGTTGVMVDPRLYLAFGISGAVQHTAGLGHPDHIVSVNVDPYCPMMAMADLAVTGDANQILDELAVRLGVAAEALG